MKKKQLTAVLCLLMFVTSFFIGCASETSLNSNQNETKLKLEERKVPVKEAIANAEADFQAAKESSTKLKLGNIRPYCNDMSLVADLEYYKRGNYKGISDPIEMYNELLSLIHLNFGENLIEDNFMTILTDEIRPEKKYDSFKEYKDALMSGTETEVCDLSYNGETSDGSKLYCEMQQSLVNFIFDKGVRYSDNDSFDSNERIAIYHVNNLDNNLDDTYPLKDGTMSIRDSIMMLEEFLNYKTGIEGNPDVKLKVVTVEVYKVCEEYYCYRYRVTREILGLTKVCIDSGILRNNTGLKFDLSTAYVVCTDDVDSYVGSSNIFNYKKINEMEKILPLSEALRIVSDNIGENSSYEVKNISLGYMDRTEKDGDVRGRMYVSWIIECGNLQDSLDTIFYVNVNTGAITVQY